MGSLSNLYISQSFQSLIHLGNDTVATSSLTTLQDGFGNSIGIGVNTAGDLFLSGSLTASLQQGYIYVGNSSGKTSAFATSSLVTNINTGSLVTTSSFNSYTSSNNQRVSSLEAATASYATSAITASSLITASFSGNTLTFTKGNGTTFGVVIPDVSGSGVPTGTVSSSAQIVELGFQTTSSFNSYTASQSTGSLLLTASFTGNTLTFTKADATTFGVVIPDVSGSTINTGSFATTGSNTFTGDQTLVDAAGNSVTLSDVSGSLMLVAKSFTSASAHLTGSAGNQVNIIFKNNDNTADTIISGSNNIFTNPSAPTVTGYKRVIGSNNIVNSAAGMPQVTGSSTPPLTITSNYFGTNGLIIRGALSGSGYTITNNVAIGTLNLCQSAGGPANNDFSRVSAVTIQSNFVNGTISLIAGSSSVLPTIAATPSITTNIVNGSATATMNSSSISLTTNIINAGAFTITNNYFSGSAGSGSLTLRENIVGGRATTTLLVQGSNPVGTRTAPAFQGNIIYGTGNLLHINADNSRVSGTTLYASMDATAVIGNTLAVTGSSLFSDLASVGSAFFGRFNADDGIRNKTSEVVFAVGTGTATGTRKTGLLIDSGSNTFVEGTLNVSGATSLNGDLVITGSLTASLQQGFVLVGDGNGRTTTVSTSSFGGGTINTGSFVTTSSFNAYTASNNQRVDSLEVNSASVNISISNLNSTTQSLNTSVSNLNSTTASLNISVNNLNNATSSYVTETESGSFLITASFSGNTLTFTKGNNTTFGVVIPDVSGSTINTGSFVTTSSFNDYTASQSTASLVTSITNLNTFSASALVSISNINSTTASLNTSVTNLNASSASQQISIDALNTNSASVNTSVSNINSTTSSLFTSASLGLTTASFAAGTLTFTKGNGTTFGVVIPDVSGSGIPTGTVSGSAQIVELGFQTTASFNSYTASQSTASLVTSITNLNTFTQSAQISINALNGATASYAISSSVAIVDAAQQSQINSLIAATSSYVNSAITASSLITASFSGNTLTFTKGDATTFGVVIPDVSGSTINTGSFVTTSSFNAYTASVTESVVTAIVTNNGSNYYIVDGVNQPKLSFVPGPTYRFDLSGIVGSHPFKFSTTANGPTEYTTGVTSGSNFIQIQVGYDTTTPLYYYCTNHNGMGNEINVLGIEKLLTTASFNSYTSSNDAKVNSLISATGSYATTGSNSFIGNQTITGSLILSSSAATDLTVIGNSVFTGSAFGNVISASITSNTASINLNTGNYFTLSIPTGTTRISPSNIQAGTSATLVITTASGSLVTFDSSVKQPSGSAYIPTSGSVDILSFVSVNSSSLFVVATKNMI